MYRSNKKGFTIVELVVVIAVVAILAAVLIPTFAGIVKKANQSADQQAVTQMNKLLATSAKADDVDGVIDILIDNDYAGDLTTYYAGYQLAWVAAKNVIVLVENDAIVFPKDYIGETFAIINPMATDAGALNNGLTAGNTIYVGDDITASEGLAAPEAGDYTVNLNGNTLTSDDYIGAWVDGAKLTISNGTINSNKNGIAVLAEENGTVELNNVQVYAPAGVNPLQCYGGTMVLNNVITSQSGEADEAWYSSVIQVINAIEKVEGKWTIYGEQATLTVNGGMYSGKRAVQISAPGGNVTINDGNFIGTEYVINGDFAPQNYGNSEGYESVITINGGTFNGAIKVSAATVLVINGGTFSVDPSQWVAEGKTVVDNGNGTWTVQ